MTNAPNLHGKEITRSVALLLFDVINDLDFPEGDALLQHALPMARNLRELRDRAERAGIPIIYANDNFGRWRSDFRLQVEHCLAQGVRGRPIAEILCPGSEHYFVLKPRHSAFYSTALEVLLKQLGTKIIILGGLAGDNCILFTASDAYLRQFSLIVPSDCIASNSVADNERALQVMEKTLKADTRPSPCWTEERLQERVNENLTSQLR